MAGHREPAPTASGARYCLLTPPRVASVDFARDLDALAETADIACLLIALDESGPEAAAAILAAVRPVAARRGIAMLVADRPDLVGARAADGVHLSEGDPAPVLARLKPAFIVGIGGLESRHAAMVAGESGADYVAFGTPHARLPPAGGELLLEQVAWWAEVFEVPCLAFADTPEMIGPLAKAGADFVAVVPAVLAAADSRALDPEV